MARINVYKPVTEADYDRDAKPALAGWFDPSTCVEEIEDSREWNGSNMVSVVSGDEHARETLYRTPGGRWVLERTSQWPGVPTAYRFLDGGEAQDWLARDGDDAVVKKYFGELADESGPDLGGRPAVGPAVNIRLGGDLQAAVDAWRSEHGGLTRAEAVRHLLREALGNPTTPAEFAAVPDGGTGEVAGFPVTRTGDCWSYKNGGAWAEIAYVGGRLVVTGFSDTQEQGTVLPVPADESVGAFASFAGQVRDYPGHPPT